MTNSLREVREEIKHASEQAGRSIRQQLRSIDEGLEEQLDWGKTESEAPPQTDDLRELEDKLAGLEKQANEQTQQRIENAREFILTYRTD